MSHDRQRDLLTKLRHDLSACSTGDQNPLFEARDGLQQLARVVAADQPTAPLCDALNLMVSSLLRRGGLDASETVKVALDLIDFLDGALASTTFTPGSGAPTGSIPMRRGPTLSLAKPADAEALDEEEADDIDVEPSFERHSLRMVNESRLGEVLLRMGVVDHPQLEQALVLQNVSRRRLGEVLMDMGLLDFDDIEEGLARQRRETLRLADELADGPSEADVDPDPGVA